MAAVQPLLSHAQAHRGPRGSTTPTATAADRLRHTTASRRPHPATSGRPPRAGPVPWCRGRPQLPGLPRGAWLAKWGRSPALSPARLSRSTGPAIADDGAAAVGAEAVDINELHMRPPLAAAGLHLRRGRAALRGGRGSGAGVLATTLWGARQGRPLPLGRHGLGAPAEHPSCLGPSDRPPSHLSVPAGW